METKILPTVLTQQFEDSGSHGIIDSFDSDGMVSNGTNSSLLDYIITGGYLLVQVVVNILLALESKRWFRPHLIQTEVLVTTVQVNTTAGFSIVLYTSDFRRTNNRAWFRWKI